MGFHYILFMGSFRLSLSRRMTMTKKKLEEQIFDIVSGTAIEEAVVLLNQCIADNKKSKKYSRIWVERQSAGEILICGSRFESASEYKARLKKKSEIAELKRLARLHPDEVSFKKTPGDYF